MTLLFYSISISMILLFYSISISMILLFYSHFRYIFLSMSFIYCEYKYLVVRYIYTVIIFFLSNFKSSGKQKMDIEIQN